MTREPWNGIEYDGRYESGEEMFACYRYCHRIIPTRSAIIMRCFFVVQGEGRGHMTQAIAMKHLLEGAGHSVCGVLVGTSTRREIPRFFLEKIGVEAHRFRSPNFAADADNRGILVGRTIWNSMKNLPEFLAAFKIFDRVLGAQPADLVVNFYEPLFGLYETFRRRRPPSVCVAHQCLSLHPEFPFPEGRRVDRFLLRTLTRIATRKSAAILGLSFTPLNAMQTGRLYVVPPLLRKELSACEIGSGNYLLVYVLSPGYAADIEAWHAQNPGVELHCFWDRQDAAEQERRDETLTFHKISDVRFLSMMAGCLGLATTAGFESVCEAMYLGKPVLMVPVAGHYEQFCNAIDGERAGAGIRSDAFDLDAFLAYLPNHKAPTDAFRAWVSSAPERIVSVLESVVGA